jgi:hypothetical protein
MKSKLLLSLLLVIGLSACSSSKSPDDFTKTGQVYKLKNYTGPEAMQNTEVVQASKQCLYAKLRPNVHYLNVKTDQGRVMVPVNVTCETY